MTCSVSGHSHESSDRTRTDEDSGGDGLGGSVDLFLSGRQLLADAEATVIRQPGITEVIAVAASESST